MAEIVSPTSAVPPPPQRKSTPDMSEEDELDASTHSQVLQRMKTDRVAVTRPEEDRRRRTIIVEKKNGSYGFTLQSYGIHYKKEQEVEMITYVDYVEYDGPAYRAGMREGDVILSINGTDMEKADHKTLVTFIKECDARMRMVVLFEDCVRKVELHMRYLQLQNVLQGKMSELERICLRERELLEGKWKTHSLPARKKATAAGEEAVGEGEMLGNRPTSTEDVGGLGKQQQKSQQHVGPPPTQMMLAYRYLDPHCRYILRPSASTGSGEYLISIAPAGPPPQPHQQQQRCRSQQYLRRVPSSDNNTTASSLPEDNTTKRSQAQQQEQKAKSSRHCHGHSCNPCHFGRSKTTTNNGDNVSLDAYDLASPCCEAQCIPVRRRSRHHSKDHHQHKHKHRSKESKERHQQRTQPAAPPAPPPQFANQPRYYDLSAGLASHCSLHSCTSSEFAATTVDGSVTSYTTSLSTDTLWDPHSDPSRGHSLKSGANPRTRTSVSYYAQPSPHQSFPTRFYPHAQVQPVSGYGYAVQKPKSWDNLTTKGGYGFGYGYLDTVAPKVNQIPPQRHSMPRKMTPAYERYTAFSDVENYAPPPSQFVQQTTTTTTTISLVGPPLCECLEGATVPKGATTQATSLTSAAGYYSSLPPRDPTKAPQAEITRL
ncbi:uncharacterized protein LOC129794341 [Lutzomyia longipalpis]|uniref:uncharacterized protein LOC129794341 n=1 Tax=Lutzomyia longipalpis TaxID=7200 RepID=UPI002483A0EE|nr:uncharacterized protein LOC129794341 [Lutzomyia longipalpis]